jgi:ATP-dependent 26S proteasome regulatory subunit
MNYARAGEGYGGVWELLDDLTTILDFRLSLYYKYHAWVGPTGEMRNMMGLAITPEEFVHNLNKSAQTPLWQRLSAEEKRDLRLAEDTIRLRLQKTKPELSWVSLCRRFELTGFEQAAVLMALAVEADEKYERLFAYLQDDVTQKRPTAAFCAKVFTPDDGRIEEYGVRFFARAAFRTLFDPHALRAGELRLRREAIGFLMGDDIAPPKGIEIYTGADAHKADNMIVGAEIAARLDALMDAACGEPMAVRIGGADGSGRRFQVRRLMDRQQAVCVFTDLSVAEDAFETIETASFLARLLRASAAFDGFDAEDEPRTLSLIESIERQAPSRGALFLLFRMIPRYHSRFAAVDIDIPELSADDRVLLYEAFMTGLPLDDNVSLDELATKFRFVPMQIKNAAEQAASRILLGEETRISGAEIHRLCYRQVTHRLDRLASRIHPNFTWDDIILPDAQKERLQRATAHVKYKRKVFGQWGFDARISYGRGLSIMLAGAPGTGKTMCAQIIARELNMEAYKINISQVVSKYIGETEKNLQELFHEAKSADCILFFDECDAIFGKRSEVKDAHDRNANIEVSYLLQQLEEHEGVCILATNLMQNIDVAFMRRITYVARFPFPDAPARRRIFLSCLPSACPVTGDIDWDYLAEKFELSGGHIKNILLSAAFMAAREQTALNMRHLLLCGVEELRKNDMIVVRENFLDYAEDIFDA